MRIDRDGTADFPHAISLLHRGASRYLASVRPGGKADNEVNGFLTNGKSH